MIYSNFSLLELVYSIIVNTSSIFPSFDVILSLIYLYIGIEISPLVLVKTF